jgi:hypothetical protein
MRATYPAHIIFSTPATHAAHLTFLFYHLIIFGNEYAGPHYAIFSILKLFHHRPLHSAEVTVWCAVSSHGIIGLFL